MQKDFHQEFELAKKIIVEASNIPLKYFNTHFEIEKKRDNSIVTIADKETESYIRSSFDHSYPQFGFIGEESDVNEKSISWIVDPIDGTAAFARSLPEFGMAIALKVEKEIIFSLIYLPTSQQLFSAYKNEGATLQDKRISSSKVTHLNDSLFSLHGSSIKSEKYKEYFETIIQNYPIRIALSVAVESTHMASGKIECLIKFNQALWDIAPESLLMQEAGIDVTDEFGDQLVFDFNKESRYNFVASTQSLLTEEKTKLYLKR